MNLSKKCDVIYEHYGERNQLIKLSEECKELDEAAILYEEEPSHDNKDHLNEEVADVLVLIKQLAQNGILDSTDILDYMNYKTERQLYRMTQERIAKCH